MARGPFQGTYQSGVRPTVVTAPDALVYINGELDVIGCPNCRRRFDLNKYITSVQADLSVESVPGSASISLAIPRHAVDDFYFEGEPVITPMMEVEIFAKGYYLLEGLPQYYPIFWGLVTEVGNAYSGGEHTVTIQCADILKWWELCKMNVNPAFTQAAGQKGRSIFGNVFFGTNPYDVIWSLAQQAFGDVIIGTGSLVSLYKEGAQQRTFQNSLSDIMRYWNERFTRIRSNLLLYGSSGVAVRGDTLQTSYEKGKSTPGKPFASSAVRHANGGSGGGQMVFDPVDPSVVAFRTQFSQAGQVNFWQSEYQTKLELANAAKEAVGYEFFMDVNGDIVFKPPFYNLDVLSNKPTSWIQDIDIIDYDFSESEAEVVTQVVLQGSFGGNIDYGMPEECTPYTSVTDYHLLRKYGWRSQTYNSEFLGDPSLMFYVGLDLLDRYNSRRHRGTINIPLRPELRLGFPIYVAPFDQVWYVQGISHNIQFGGRAQTTLTLTARRGKFISPRGIGKLAMTSYGSGQSGGSNKQAASKPDPKIGYSSRQLASNARFSLDYGDVAQLPPSGTPPGQPAEGGKAPDDPYAPLILRHPKTGRIMGHPNVVMMYTRPFAPTPDQLSGNLGRKKAAAQKKITPAQQKANDQRLLQEVKNVADVYANQKADDLDSKHLSNRYSFGVTSAGVYIYAHDRTQVIKDILLLPTSRLSVTSGQSNPFGGTTGMIRPVSDERGFEVVGHFRYGRGVALRDGALVLGDKTRVDVGTQLALSGTLYDSLVAQSSGLVSMSTRYANPADAVARLQPEDLQTAAVINPETGAPEYVNTGTNFVDTAPLGSPEQQGVPVSVEATQLSRALTLAEMTVRMDAYYPNENCPCLLGRSDLAFINVGYQVKTLGQSSPDKTSLGDSTQKADAAAQSNYQKQLKDWQAAVDKQRTDYAKADMEAREQARKNWESDPDPAKGPWNGNYTPPPYPPTIPKPTPPASTSTDPKEQAEAQDRANWEADPDPAKPPYEQWRAQNHSSTTADKSVTTGGTGAPIAPSPPKEPAIPPEPKNTTSMPDGIWKETSAEYQTWQTQVNGLKLQYSEAWAQYQKDLAAYEKAAAEYNTQLASDINAGGDAAGSQAVADAYQQAIDEGKPVSEAMYATMGTSLLMSRVDQYLFDLYSKLDAPHQRYEQALRGKFLPPEWATSEDIRFGTTPSPGYGNFEPPFSMPNRSAMGDPQANIDTAKNALDTIPKTFEDFGGKLKAVAKRTELEGQISKNKSEMSKLQAELDSLMKAKSSRTTIVGMNVDDRIAEIQKDIARLAQDTASKQAELDELNQKYPP